MSHSTRFNSGSLFLFASEGLLSWCDVLRDSRSISAQGIFYSFSKGAPLSFGQVILSCYSIIFLSDCSSELSISLKFQQGSQVSFKLWWRLLLNCTGADTLEKMFRLASVLLQFVGLYSLVEARGLHSSCSVVPLFIYDASAPL